VSNKSFNYYNQEDAIVCSFSHEINPDRTVVLSLEDKSIAHKFPKHWIILEEPVADIHSLIYYSKLVVSSGDSMAREGAMLGVPSIYCGIREMKANKLLMDLHILEHLPGKRALTFINETEEKMFNEPQQIKVRSQLYENWDDMIVFMKEKINQYKN
jgi:predicted glycosyltransferase